MKLDVLLPTCDRAAALAVVLTGLLGQQTCRVVVADQSREPVEHDPVVAGVLRVLRHAGHDVEVHHRPERRGIAEQRQWLLDHAVSDRVLCLDDDVLLGRGAVDLLDEALAELRCGFVGMAQTGLSHLGDVRTADHAHFEPWEGPVTPERVRKDSPGWDRWRLHNAATPTHLGDRVPEGQTWLAYKVTWVSGCVLYDTAALRAAGGFTFWEQLGPTGAGEDVAAQLAVMELFGGAGLLPSRAHHLEIPTAVPVRERNGYDLLA